MSELSPKGLKLRAGFFMACALLSLSVLESPANAASDGFKAELRIIAPLPGDLPAQWIPGTISHQDGKWSLAFGIVSGQATSSMSLMTVEVDAVARKAFLSDSGRAIHQDLDFERLSQANFSEFAAKPEVLGGLVLVGDRLAQKARYVRDGIFDGRKIKVYSFRESKDVFGQIFFSPEYGIPLKVDTYDAVKGQRTFVEVDLTN